MLLQFLFVFVVLLFHSKESLQTDIVRQIKQPYIYEINVWSTCTDQCGNGYQQKLRACFQNTLYLVENIPFDQCSNKFSEVPTMRKCNNGDCVNGYIWYTGHWSRCSHSCGHFGIQTREVECLDTEGELVDVKFCEKFKKPESLRNCNRYNCSPKFISGIWGPCLDDENCKTGLQHRTINCVSLLNNGTIVKFPFEACTEKGLIPPSTSRYCQSNKCAKGNNSHTEIKTDNSTLIQMLKMKRFVVQAGQTSHVLYGTRISLKCPTTNFPNKRIIWIHNDRKFQYKRNVMGRLWVTKKGRMVINLFSKQDEGKWICKAGNLKEKLELKSRTLYEGYQDWKIRNIKFQSDMPNVLTKLSVIMKDIAKWIAGKWSQCSVSCEGTGFQYRSVYCEKLFDHFYYRLNDEECLKYLEAKPISKRECSRVFRCPQWEIDKLALQKCTNDCIGFEKALMSVNFKCSYRDQSVEFNNCNITSKPVMKCFNEKCHVEWKISSWTKCSVSCGKTGIQARYIICVWTNTGKPAGDMCNKMNLTLPQVVKSCQPPQCHLKCVDIYSICEKRKKFCHIEMFYFRCCKTCRAFFQDLQNKS